MGQVPLNCHYVLLACCLCRALRIGSSCCLRTCRVDPEKRFLPSVSYVHTYRSLMLMRLSMLPHSEPTPRSFCISAAWPQHLRILSKSQLRYALSTSTRRTPDRSTSDGSNGGSTCARRATSSRSARTLSLTGIPVCVRASIASHSGSPGTYGPLAFPRALLRSSRRRRNDAGRCACLTMTGRPASTGAQLRNRLAHSSIDWRNAPTGRKPSTRMAPKKCLRSRRSWKPISRRPRQVRRCQAQNTGRSNTITMV